MNRPEGVDGRGSGVALRCSICFIPSKFVCVGSFFIYFEISYRETFYLDTFHEYFYWYKNFIILTSVTYVLMLNIECKFD